MTAQRSWRQSIVVLMAASILTVPAGADVLDLHPLGDAWIDNKTPDENYGSDPDLVVRNKRGLTSSDWEADALVRFDLVTIPPGAEITSATLYLYYHDYSNNDPVGRILECRPITDYWHEATVTWNTRSSWSSVVSESVVPSTYGWMTWDVTGDVLAFFVADVSYGWVIKDPEGWHADDMPNTMFYSKEYGALIPYLSIEYTLPAGTTYSVCPTGPADFTTIQDCIDAAGDGVGDVCELCDAIFTGQGNRDIRFQGKALAVRSQGGNPENCMIDCQASESNEHYGVRFANRKNTTRCSKA